ncbi:hypothetical protein CH56_4268 (plasmid) [Yersinia pestis Angola]|nr:hypothetical protein CH56_4268 [Yersinia pestis Angola]
MDISLILRSGVFVSTTHYPQKGSDGWFCNYLIFIHRPDPVIQIPNRTKETHKDPQRPKKIPASRKPLCHLASEVIDIHYREKISHYEE